jgi:anti-sigma B factor antagonist
VQGGFVVQAFSAVWQSDRVLYLVGELDLASESEVLAALEERPEGLDELVIDLSGLTFMDSTGIRVVEGMATGPRGVRTVLRAPRPSVRRVLDLVGVVHWPNVAVRGGDAAPGAREDLLIF